MSKEITYVFDNVEVRKTGRSAINTKKTTLTGKEFTKVLYEITPTDSFNGIWLKWVPDDELYVIK